jgi:hypothetical protein
MWSPKKGDKGGPSYIAQETRFAVACIQSANQLHNNPVRAIKAGPEEASVASSIFEE